MCFFMEAVIMTREKKKMRKNHKKITPKGKKITTGAASVLLGAGIMVGANARPVKAASSREDEITEVENANVLAGEKTEITVEQKSTDAAQDTQVEQNTAPEVQTDQNAVENVQTTQETAPTEEVQVTPQADNAVQNTVQNDSEAAAAQANTEVQNAEQTNNASQAATSTNATNSAQTNEATAQEDKQTSNVGGVVGTGENATQNETAPAAKAATANTSATITPDTDTPSKTDADATVKDANKAEQDRLTNKVNELIAKVENLQGSIAITPNATNKDDFKATLSTLETVKNKLNTYTTEQITNLETAVNAYITELTDYNQNYATYQKFMTDLKKYGLYDETVDVNPDKLTQKLIFGEETNAKVEADLLGHDYVKFDDFDRWGLKYDQDKMKFLNHFCRITQDNVDGNIFKLIYTGLSNTSYNDEKITKIELTFSDWEFSDNYAANKGKPAGIYFHDDPSKGFWYVNTTGVTMDMVLYAGEGDNEHVVTLGDNAYVVLNSMNSEGKGSSYIEKAQIINGTNADGTEYGGKGVPLPESAVNIHAGSESNVTGGGDILYADQNINMIAKPGTLSAEAEANVKAYWGEDKGQFIIDNYLGWDATPADEAASGVKNTRKIFATGMFQVHGNRIKIRYSNDVNAGWSTYSSELPSLTFKAEKPNIAPLVYTPGEIVLETSDVTIHYIDVNGVNKPDTDITPSDGLELKFQNFDNLFIDGKYSINGLWDYASAGYKLVKQDDLDKVVITKDHKDLYIYLTHDTITENEDKTVTQNIKYVYGGETETPVENGKHDVTRYLSLPEQ